MAGRGMLRESGEDQFVISNRQLATSISGVLTPNQSFPSLQNGGSASVISSVVNEDAADWDVGDNRSTELAIRIHSFPPEVNQDSPL